MLASHSVITVEWTFLTAAVLLVGARLYVRVRMRKQPVSLSDGWLCIAAAFALGLVICDTLTYKANAMDNFSLDSVYVGQIRFATNYLFDCGMYFPKFSMLATYFKLIPKANNIYMAALWMITGVTAFGFLCTFFADTFWCGANPAVNWSADNNTCSAFTSMALVRLNWSWNFVAEALMFLFPFPIIRMLNLLPREKIALSLIFALGFTTLVVSTGRFITMLHVDNDISIYIWATAELTVSVMAVSMTALRPLLRSITHFLMSSVPDYTHRSRFKVALSRIESDKNESRSMWRDSGTAGTAARGEVESPADSEIELNDLRGSQEYRTEITAALSTEV
ncbi:hypothetical protein JX266_014193 [Neoarthrinium moseri]|nr:hypothetical protein JX266_014193 [Neoarthrinium moseri]